MKLQRVMNFAVAVVTLYAALLVLAEATVASGWSKLGYAAVALLLLVAAVFCAVTPPVDRHQFEVAVRIYATGGTVVWSPPTARRGEPRQRPLGVEGPHRHGRLH